MENKIKVLINVLNYLVQNDMDFTLQNNNAIITKKFKLGIYLEGIELSTVRYHKDFRYNLNISPDLVLNDVITVLNSGY